MMKKIFIRALIVFLVGGSSLTPAAAAYRAGLTVNPSTERNPFGSGCGAGMSPRRVPMTPRTKVCKSWGLGSLTPTPPAVRDAKFARAKAELRELRSHLERLENDLSVTEANCPGEILEETLKEKRFVLRYYGIKMALQHYKSGQPKELYSDFEQDVEGFGRYLATFIPTLPVEQSALTSAVDDAIFYISYLINNTQRTDLCEKIMKSVEDQLHAIEKVTTRAAFEGELRKVDNFLADLCWVCFSPLSVNRLCVALEDKEKEVRALEKREREVLEREAEHAFLAWGRLNSRRLQRGNK